MSILKLDHNIINIICRQLNPKDFKNLRSCNKHLLNKSRLFFQQNYFYDLNNFKSKEHFQKIINPNYDYGFYIHPYSFRHLEENYIYKDDDDKLEEPFITYEKHIYHLYNLMKICGIIDNIDNLPFLKIVGILGRCTNGTLLYIKKFKNKENFVDYNLNIKLKYPNNDHILINYDYLETETDITIFKFYYYCFPSLCSGSSGYVFTGSVLANITDHCNKIIDKYQKIG